MDLKLSRRQFGLLLAAVTAVISGFAVFINGYGVRAWAEVSSPTVYTTFKNLAAALMIGAVAAFLTRRGSKERPTRPSGRKQWVMLITIGVIGGSIPFVLFFEGLSRASSTQAAFIHKSLFIWVAILAVVFLKERIGWPHLAALGLLVWGQVTLVGSIEGVFGAGELMILAATLLWSAEVIVAKRVLAGVSSTTLAIARMTGGSVLLVAYVLIRGVEVDWALVTSSHWMWILVTGLFLSGYVITWFAALSRAPAVDVTAVLVGGAVITAILQTTVRGVELPSPLGLALLTGGAVLMLVGSWMRPARGD